MKKTCSLIIGFIILALPSILFAEGPPTVTVSGLRIVGPGHGLNGSELQAFHEQSGTTLALVVQAPENRKIVEIDDDGCSLVELMDDHGHNLLDGVRWGGFPRISDDGRLALIEVSSKSRPSKDATRIRVRGIIQMRVAASAVTEKIDHLKMEVGYEASFRDETMKVMKAETEDGSLTLVVQISRSLQSNMKDIRFTTKNGDPVEIWGRGSFTFGNAAQMEYNLDTESIPESLSVEIDLWQELESLDVSFELATGLGL